MKRLLLPLLALGLGAAVHAEPVTWKVDPSHSSVGFSIRHFFAKVPGTFANLESTIVFDAENVGASTATATIGVASVDTDNEKRDEHLKNDDFFSVAKFPNISFTSTKWV